MLIQIISVLVPVFFVLALGYAAGRVKAFDSDQVTGISDLVMDFALPASLFVGTVRTSRTQLLQEGPFFLAVLISYCGLYLVALLVGRFVFRHRLGDAALLAMAITTPGAPFFGTAILSSLYGASSAISIGGLAIMTNVLVVPITLILLEFSQQSEQTGKKLALGPLIGRSALSAFKAPVVWAPLLAVILVLVGVSVPQLIDSMLNLIGATTSGVALFVAGLSVAARKFSFNLEIGYNIAVKMILQPMFFFVLAALFILKPPYSHEGFIMMAFPTAVVSIIFATRYKRQEAEVSSTLALTTLLMLIVLPIAIYVAGG